MSAVHALVALRGFVCMMFRKEGEGSEIIITMTLSKIATHFSLERLPY